ncbi:hypothetical protein [Cyclobacterium salsum]|uniref:hypothetical protein n=1 Tax=Cyclobacterium salsum TaxID=2666329 RepID=UPI0013918C52|nr:hypothetical protein [Cyclobacterium salsum]
MKSIIKIVFSLPFDIVWMSIMFMGLMPFGTFDYSQVGFYLCIGQATMVSVIIRILLKRYQKDYRGKIK